VLPVQVTRGDLLVAAGCTAWAGSLLATEWRWAATSGSLTALAVLLRRRGALAGALLVVIEVVNAWQGVPLENPSSLAAGFVVLFTLGQIGATRVAALTVAALVVLATVRDDWGVPSGAFTAIILTAVWAAGWLVRRRDAAAQSARATAAALAAVDPHEAAAALVAAERTRLAGDAVAVVRRAVLRMRSHAGATTGSLDAQHLLAIQDEGRAAVAELRRLLGLLRDSDLPASPAVADPASAGPVTTVGRPDVAVAAAAAGLCTLEWLAWSTVGRGAGSLVLGLVLCATLVLRRSHPAAAVLLGCAPAAVALAGDVAIPDGLWNVVVVSLLGWSVAVTGRPVPYAAFSALIAMWLLQAHRDAPGNEAMLLALALLGAVPGHLWSQRDRIGQAAETQAEVLRRDHQQLAEQARREERLRLARELHDVVSHAVNVMVLQAAAAAAQRDRDPVAARASVIAVQEAADRALVELDALVGLLAAPVERRTDTDLAEALQDLVTRMRAGGLKVQLVSPPHLDLPEDVSATTYRIVQEALTNVVRHAPGSTATVGLHRDDGHLEVRVRDDGAGPDPNSEPGFGLVGLAERVRAVGGRLRTGPVPGGGFEVHARLPVASQAGLPS
jgi:signal transduction histidine kinase